jgi:hypothetical protein
MIILCTYTPTWFDWLSVGLTIASIIGAFIIAQLIYNRGVRSKEKEEKKLIDTENILFNNNIVSLKESISSQIQYLSEYEDSKNFRLVLQTGIQINFLNYIDIKNIYKKYGFDNNNSLQVINSLLTHLYSISNFIESLRSELATYIEKYNSFENKFYLYRNLLYTLFYSLCNKRAQNIEEELHGKKIQFSPDDIFMSEYSELLNSTFNNPHIIGANGLKSRKLLVEQFIVPLINISYKYIPQDNDAIEINDIANSVLSAFNDMENLEAKHFNTIASYKNVLVGINEQIDSFSHLRE